MAQKKKQTQNKTDNQSEDVPLAELADFGGVCEILHERFPGQTYSEVLKKLVAEQGIHVMRVRLTLARTKSVREIFLPAVFPLMLAARCIEACFDFHGGHLFRFHADALSERPFDASLDDQLGDLFDNVEGSLPLGYILPQKGARAMMEYDFGDGWEIRLLRLADKVVKEAPSLCFKSVGMDAIEDCGGTWGLAQFAEIYQKIIDGRKLTKDEKEQLRWCHGTSKLSADEAKDCLAGPTPEEVSARLVEAAHEFDDIQD